MIEIRNDEIADQAGQAKWAELLGTIFQRLKPDRRDETVRRQSGQALSPADQQKRGQAHDRHCQDTKQEASPIKGETSRTSRDRELVRHANVWHLWALGVGAVISGHFSGWNFGFATGGWGGMLVAGIIIAIMYLGLVFCIAEMSPALPHTGAAYSFARTAMGPWGGFITGLCENVEYVVTPAVIAFFIGSYVGGIVGGDIPPYVWWVVTYIAFLALNVFGVALSFRVTLIVTLVSLAVLVVFWLSAIPNMDFSRWALNIGVGSGRRSGRTAGRQRLLLPVRLLGRARHLALRGLAVPRHRATAAGGGRIGRPQARHAARHHCRHADADGLGLHDRAAQPVGHRRRLVQARFIGRAAARRLPRRSTAIPARLCSA